MPLYLSTTDPQIVVKPDYQPVIMTGYTPTIIVGSGSTSVSQSGITWIISTPSGVLPTVLIGSGDTTVNNVSGNTWIVYSNTGATGNFVTMPQFTGHTGDTSIHFKQSGITINENQVTNLVSDLAGKSSTGHTHSQYTLQSNFTGHTSDTSIHFKQSGITINENQVTNLVSDLAGKSGTGHTHTGVYAPVVHSHPQYSLTGHTHVIANVTGLQAALDSKSNTGHTHSQYATVVNLTGHTSDTSIHFKQSGITITQNQVTGLVNALAGKSSTGHTHTGVYAPVVHNHSYTGSTITDKPSFLGSGVTIVSLVGNTYRIYTPSASTGTMNHASLTNLGWLVSKHTGQTGQLAGFGLTGETTYFDPSSFATANHLHTGIYSPTGHTHTIANISGLQTALDGKSNTGHTHTIANISGLQTALDSKSNTGHTHSQYSLTTHTHTTLTGLTITESQVTNLPTDLSSLQTQINGLSAIQSSARNYIFHHNGSDIAGYEVLSPVVLSLTGATEVVPANNTTVLIDSYATPSQGLGVTGITSGVWTFHFHASVNTANSANLRFDVYKRVGAIETLLFQSALVPLTSTSLTEYQINEAHAAVTGLNLTDRLIVKVYAVTTANRTITWTYNSSAADSFMQVPIPYITTLPWSSVSSKPAWLSGTTLGTFEAQHSHSTLYFPKANTITGATNQGSGQGIYTGTTANNIKLKSLKVTGTGLAISSDATSITISGASGGGVSTATFNTYTGTTAPAQFMPKLASVVTITGTTDTIASADGGTIIKYTNTGARTITLPTGCTTNTQFTAINYGGTTTVSFVAGAGATLHSKNSALKLATIYGAATWIYEGSNVWIGFGDLTV